jgi:cation transport ATPase
MPAPGRALEAAAQRRAPRDLSALVRHAPRSARRRTGSEVRRVSPAEVVVDDPLMVGPGEVVPVNGRVGPPTPVSSSVSPMVQRTSGPSKLREVRRPRS